MDTEQDRIRDATPEDSEAIARIYNHFVAETIVTFEEEAISGAEMATRVQAIQSTGFPWLVFERAGKMLGYAYAGKWQSRCAYRFTAESTIYLDPAAVGQGIGTRLYDALFGELEEHSIHAVIGGVSLPNPASIALHEKFGFEKVAHYKEVGFKYGEWIDVGYWQKIL